VSKRPAWVPTLVVVLAGLGLVRCDVSPEGPTPSVPTGGLVTARAVAASVDVGGGGAFPTWSVGGASGDFRVHPAKGQAPLTVDVNMCHSTDPNPGISLHYHVTWGDGSDDRGFCRLSHVYSGSGSFTGVACVWDEIPAHYPGSCDTFPVDVAGSGARNQFCHSITATIGGLNIAEVCPTKATQWCQSTPIIATRSADAKAACEACYGVGHCFGGGGEWESFDLVTVTEFVYSTDPGCAALAPGVITDGCAASTLRWAP
jgi:hypothetical protein